MRNQSKSVHSISIYNVISSSTIISPFAVGASSSRGGSGVSDPVVVPDPGDINSDYKTLLDGNVVVVDGLIVIED